MAADRGRPPPGALRYGCDPPRPQTGEPCPCSADDPPPGDRRVPLPAFRSPRHRRRRPARGARGLVRRRGRPATPPGPGSGARLPATAQRGFVATAAAVGHARADAARGWGAAASRRRRSGWAAAAAGPRVAVLRTPTTATPARRRSSGKPAGDGDHDARPTAVLLPMATLLTTRRGTGAAQPLPGALVAPRGVKAAAQQDRGAVLREHHGAAPRARLLALRAGPELGAGPVALRTHHGAALRRRRGAPRRRLRPPGGAGATAPSARGRRRVVRAPHGRAVIRVTPRARV